MHVTREPLRRELEARMHDERRMLSEGGRKRRQQREGSRERSKKGERGEWHNSTVGSSNLGQRRRLGSGKGGAKGTGTGNGTSGVGGRGDSDLSTRPIFYLKLHKAGSTTVTFALLLRYVPKLWQSTYLVLYIVGPFFPKRVV